MATASSARVPSPLSPLVGRDGRVERAWQSLEGARLLTLTGPGGCGKTRLAIELAALTLRQTRGSTEDSRPPVWIELAALTDARVLAEHVATTLGVPDRHGRAPADQIVERFVTEPALLVLDNCEHLVAACAELVARILRDCPDARVLATSREALGVAGERTFLVPPLSLPPGDEPTLDAAEASDAVALFVERARDVRSEFTLTARNAGAVARICRRLDGIPLAIELAAARVRALDPGELATRLEAGIGLLDTAARSAMPRHRTIRDTIDWSYRLLTDEERSLLRRLAVFHGSFALDAVESVCGPAAGAPALDGLTGLLDKSLLLYDVADAGTRYRLLETVREYARERLAEAGETDASRERHARFYVALAERAAPALFGGAGDESWLARLDEDTPNLREALDWCEQQSARLHLALRLAVALHWYWYARGRFNEGRLRLGVALTFAEDVPALLRGRALAALGRLAIWQGDAAAVHAPMEEAVELLTPLGDRQALAYALCGLGIAASLEGRLAEARRLVDEAAATAVIETPEVLLASIEYWRGIVAGQEYETAEAGRCFDRALAIGRRLGHKTTCAYALCTIGRLAVTRGEYDHGRRALDESLAIFRDLDDSWGIVHALQGLARLAAATGHALQAARTIGAADSIRERLEIDLTQADRAFQDATVSASLASVTEPEFWSAWREGRMAPLHTTIAATPESTNTEHTNTEQPTREPANREHERGTGQPSRAERASASLAEAFGGGGNREPGTALSLRVRALGPLEVHAGGRRVEKHEWGSSRARELLVFLLCHPDGCTKAQIGLGLWPDASPVQLRNTFHVTLHRLRNALRLTDVIQADGERYRLNPALTCELDAALFESEARAAIRDLRGGKDATPALAAAIERYRGEFLSGETAGEWADQRRERLRALQGEALEALGRARMERKRYAEAVDAFSALLTMDPVNEDACRRQMICLANLGDRASALRAYDALVRALRDDLGVQPARDTVALREKLAVSGL